MVDLAPVRSILAKAQDRADQIIAEAHHQARAEAEEIIARARILAEQERALIRETERLKIRVEADAEIAWREQQQGGKPRG